MGKGLPRSLANADFTSVDVMEAAVIDIDVEISIDGSGVGFGNALIKDLPRGRFLISDFAIGTLTLTAGANIDADAAGDIAVGTTGVDSTSFSGNDATLLESTEITFATSEEVVTDLFDSAHPRSVLDNTNGTQDVYLNVLIDDADISDDSTVTAVGKAVLLFKKISDD